MDVLLVDGYNMIGAWPELVRLKQRDIGQARKRLIELMEEYEAYTNKRIIIVFDALYVRGTEHHENVNRIKVIYTKENETADECIERLVKSLKNVKNQVYVATSDYMEQRTIFSRGALRISARELQLEMKNMETNIRHQLEYKYNERAHSRIPINGNVLKKFEKWRRGSR